MKIPKSAVDRLLASEPNLMTKSEMANVVDSLRALKAGDLKSSSPAPGPSGNVFSKLTIENSNDGAVPSLDETQSTADCTTPTSLQSDDTKCFEEKGTVKATSSPKAVDCTAVTASSPSDGATSPASIKTSEFEIDAGQENVSEELEPSPRQGVEVPTENATPSSTATAVSFHSAKGFTSPVPVDKAETVTKTSSRDLEEAMEPATEGNLGGCDLMSMKIVHGNKTRNITLLRKTNGATLPTEELADLMAAAFAIPDSHRIVGFAAKKHADGVDDENAVFVPLSVLVSGHFNYAEVDQFELLLKAKKQDDNNASYQDDCSSGLSDSGMTLKVESFVLFVRGLVEDKRLDPVHGDVLSKHVQAAYGSSASEIKGPIKMAFVLSEWTRNIETLTSAISALGDAILREQDSDDVESETHLRLDNMDFLLEVVELAFLEAREEWLFPQEESKDLDLEQLMALCEAIIASHPSIVAAYKSYRSTLLEYYSAASGTDDDPDADSPEHALDFLLYALRRVGLSLQPLEEGPLEEGPLDDDEAEFSHAELALTVAAGKLPKSAQETVVELYRKGDEFLRTALQIYVMEDDMEELENAVLIRLKIQEDEGGVDCDALALVDSSAKSIVDDCPQHVVAAVAVLVEYKRITQDAAATIVATFSMGNAVALELAHMEFLETGDVLAFLSQLELFAAEDKENIGSGINKYDRALGEAMRRMFHEMVMIDDLSSPSAEMKGASLEVQQVSSSTTTGNTPSDRVKERRYALQLLTSYLVDTENISKFRANLLLQRFDDDADLNAAFGCFEVNNDVAKLVRTLQNIPL